MHIRNEYLQVEISAMGAELMSVYDLKHKTELLWNGDAAYWKRRSPILFPNVVIFYLQSKNKLFDPSEPPASPAAAAEEEPEDRLETFET